MDEFSIRSGKMSGGVLSAALAGVKYIAIPLIIAIVLLFLLGEANGMMEEAGDGEIDFDLAGIEDTIIEVRNMAILFGIPVVAFAFFKGFYPKGSLARMTFGILMVGSICLWIWFATMGGDLGFELEDVGLGLDITPLVYLFLLGAGIKAVFYVAEIGSYRDEYLSSKDEEPFMAPQPASTPELANDGGVPEEESVEELNED